MQIASSRSVRGRRPPAPAGRARRPSTGSCPRTGSSRSPSPARLCAADRDVGACRRRGRGRPRARPVACVDALARLQPPELEADIGPAGARRRHPVDQARSRRGRGCFSSSSLMRPSSGRRRSSAAVPAGQADRSLGHGGDCRVVDHLARRASPRAGPAEDRAADREALADRLPARPARTPPPAPRLGASSPSSSTPRQCGSWRAITARDAPATRRRRPGAAASTSRGGRRARRTAPWRAARVVVVDRRAAACGGITSSSSSWPVRRQASASVSTCRSCSARSAGSVVRVVEDQALDAVLGRPLAQGRSRGRRRPRSASGREPGSSTGRPIHRPVPVGLGRARPRRSGRRADARRRCRPPRGHAPPPSSASRLKCGDALARGAGARPPSPRTGRGGRRRRPAPAASRAVRGWSTSGAAPARASSRSAPIAAAPLRRKRLQLGPARASPARSRGARPRRRRRRWRAGSSRSSGRSRSQPRRKPLMKASPAPSTLNTSTGKPGP